MMGPAGPQGPPGPPGPPGPADPDFVPTYTSAAEAERRVKDFFRASGRARRGLGLQCPFCGASMAVKLRGYDQRAFLGCTRYPSCSGTFDIPDAVQEEAKNWERQMIDPRVMKSMLPDRSEDARRAEEAKILTHAAHDKDYVNAGKRQIRSLDEDIDEVLDRGMPPGRTTEVRGVEWEDEVFHTFKAIKDIKVGTRVKIRSRDEFYFDGKILLYFNEESHLPQLKALVHTDWATHMGLSEAREIAAYRARVKKEKAMKESVDEGEDVPSNSIKARLVRSAKKAPYRMARMRALTSGRKALLDAAKSRVKPAAYDMIEAFLDTDAGQGAIIGLIGLAAPLTPKFGKNKHVQSLAEEFLDEGVAKGFNQVLSLVAMIVEPAIASAIAEIPGVDAIADKVVPKRRKKRVATPVRVNRSEPAEAEAEEEELDSREESRPRNALRSIAR